MHGIHLQTASTKQAMLTAPVSSKTVAPDSIGESFSEAWARVMGAGQPAQGKGVAARSYKDASPASTPEEKTSRQGEQASVAKDVPAAKASAAKPAAVASGAFAQGSPNTDANETEIGGEENAPVSDAPLSTAKSAAEIAPRATQTAPASDGAGPTEEMVAKRVDRAATGNFPAMVALPSTATPARVAAGDVTATQGTAPKPKHRTKTAVDESRQTTPSLPVAPDSAKEEVVPVKAIPVPSGEAADQKAEVASVAMPNENKAAASTEKRGKAVASADKSSAAVASTPASPTERAPEVDLKASTSAVPAATPAVQAAVAVHVAGPAASIETASSPAPQSAATGNVLPHGGSEMKSVASADSASTTQANPAQAHTVLSAGPRELEVGVMDGTHGWLKIRAELGTDGGVNASVTSSAAAHEALRQAMPEMASYLETEAVSVSRISLHRAADSTIGTNVSRDGDPSQGSGTSQRGDSQARRDGVADYRSGTNSGSASGTARGFGNWNAGIPAAVIAAQGGFYGAGNGSWLSVRA